VNIPCEGLLFDNDGVLVDSDLGVDQAWSQWARARGLSADRVTAMVHGRRSADTVALLVPDPGERPAALAEIDRLEIEAAATTSVRALRCELRAARSRARRSPPAAPARRSWRSCRTVEAPDALRRAAHVVPDERTAEAVRAAVGLRAVHQAAVEEQDVAGRHVDRHGVSPGGGGTYSRAKDSPGSASSGQNTSMRWVPGTTSRPPLSRSITSQAIHAATQVPGSTRR
jgi:beta-phosphoglucomutase-like phosphatase (HAD superfamily)